ncbi:MAG: DUF2017 family protein [Propionibacteriales bacterium]|nr:DUF2017 family protein [Propionibacteriales bacterium]
MTPGFSRGRRGRVLGSFSVPEAVLLRNLVSQVVELVHDEAPPVAHSSDPLESMLGRGGPVAAPEDPVLARLLPDAYSGDDEAAGEFRRFTEPNLREQKAANGRSVISDLERGGLSEDSAETDENVELDLGPDQVRAWLRSLTDVRLALATRLGIGDGDEDRWESMPDDDPRRYVHEVYDWLGYVQETLVQSLD